MRVTILFFITCAIVSGGCSTFRSTPRLIVSNASGYAVSNVIVESDGFTHYTAPSIDSHSAAPAEPFKRGRVRTATIRWTNQGGDVVARTVQLEPPAPETFRGKIYIQIETNSNAKVFFMEGPDRDKGVLPWTSRESWEGSPYIPVSQMPANNCINALSAIFEETVGIGLR